MKTEKFEEFVMSICKPRGIVPSREEWARMHELRARHVRFAIVLGRIKKRRYVEIVPQRSDSHSYARWLSFNLRRGNAVLHVGYERESYVRVLSFATWKQDYQRIVAPQDRAREILAADYQPHKVRPKSDRKYGHIEQLWKATDYKEPDPENPYRRRCPNHGFARTAHANAIMDRLGALCMYL